MLSREEILKCTELPREVVDVPEWGGQVTVRALTAAERDHYEIWCADQRKAGTLGNVRAKFVAVCVVNGKGGRLFTPHDVEALGDLNSAPVDRIWEVGRRLSKMDKETEEVAKNSEAGGASSISGSPPASAVPSGNCSPALAQTS